MSIKISKMSFWNIHIDFDKSHDSFIFDKSTNREYLDFFGMYASVPVGYNHPIFDESFTQRLSRAATIKLTNCEFESDIKSEFVKKFHKFAGLGIYNQYHFACTGALAVECACKLALQHTGKTKIVSLENSYHGIHGYGNFTTGKFFPVAPKLDGLPDLNWAKIRNTSELEDEISKGDVGGILVEPIQATFGDNHLDKKYLKEISDLAKQNNIPLIFDEIQTGFGTTGKPWYFQHTDVVPDLVVFGKKSQVCGVMTTPDISFDKSGNLCCTFDGDILDMLRSVYVMKAYEELDLLNNADRQGKRIVSELKQIDGLYDVRGVGLLVAFDLISKESRDMFVDKLRNSGMICNPTGEKSVRLRPNLAVADQEVDLAIKTIRSVV